MPELPDLQVFSRNLHKKIKGKRITGLIVHKPKKLNVPVNQLEKAVLKRSIGRVGRDGKELRLELDNDQILGFHLMLNGELHLIEPDNPPKYSILEIIFEDKSGLALTDRRGLAKVILDPETSDGMDALSGKLTPEYLIDKLSQKKTSIKNSLLDQHIIRGIGNAYADEILWNARISPFSISNLIPEEKIRKLLKSIKEVLNNAEKQILQNQPDITFGEVRDFLLIHHSDRKESPDGATIHVKKTGSRKTYYTDEQELFS